MYGVSVPQNSNRITARGLSINTDIPQKVPLHKIKDLETFSELLTAPAHKQTFGFFDCPQTAKISEALTSTNWRNDRVGLLDNHASIGNACCQCSKDPTKDIKLPRPALRVDTNISPIHSSFKTKRDGIQTTLPVSAPSLESNFKSQKETAHAPRLEHRISDGENMWSPLKKKPLLRLASLSPATRDGYLDAINWCKTKPLYESFPQGTFGTALITPVNDEDEPDRSSNDVQFPLVEMQAVKRSKRFVTRPWDSLPDAIKNAEAKWDMPYSAGVPSANFAKLIVERDQYLEELMNAPQNCLDKSILSDDFPASTSVSSELHQPNRPLDPQTEDQARGFEALLGKLQKSAASRLSSLDPASIEAKPANSKTSIEPQDRSNVHGSHATPIDGYFEHNKQNMWRNSTSRGPNFWNLSRSSKLNPQATEFSCQDANVKRLDSGPLSSFPRYTPVEDAWGNMPQALHHTDISLILAKLENLQLQINQACMLATMPQPEIYPPINGLTQLLRPQPWLPVAEPSVPTNSSLEIGGAVPETSGLVTASSTSQALPSSLYDPTSGKLSSQPWAFPTLPSIDGAVTQPILAKGPPPGLFGNRFGQDVTVVPTKPFSQLAQPQHTAGQHQTPPGSHTVFSGPTFNNAGAVPISIHSNFGPKPVRKPRGPVKAGDPHQGMQQMEYEAYLEWKRSTDISYAQKCRARQAKRADRLRSERETSSGTQTEAKPPVAGCEEKTGSC